MLILENNSDVLIVWHALMVESNSGELVTLTSKNFSHLQKVELPWEKIVSFGCQPLLCMSELEI